MIYSPIVNDNLLFHCTVDPPGEVVGVSVGRRVKISTIAKRALKLSGSCIRDFAVFDQHGNRVDPNWGLSDLAKHLKTDNYSTGALHGTELFIKEKAS